MSGAMARYPAAASASNWCRHEYQHSGKPWQRSTVGPLPASARCIRMPFVSINRCEIVIANLRKIQSHCELKPQPKWLRRHPVERRTAKTTCSTDLFSSRDRASGSIGARRPQHQKAKYSLRADVFRFGSNNGHRSKGLACPFDADIVGKVFLGDKTKFSRTADAFRMCRFEDFIVSKRSAPTAQIDRHQAAAANDRDHPIK